MLTQDSTPPENIHCRGGKTAKLEAAPEFNAINDAWFVHYESSDGWRFSLFWPEMRQYRTGPDSPCDAVDPPQVKCNTGRHGFPTHCEVRDNGPVDGPYRQFS
jgi:hypothetical protein